MNFIFYKVQGLFFPNIQCLESGFRIWFFHRSIDFAIYRFPEGDPRQVPWKAFSRTRKFLLMIFSIFRIYCFLSDIVLSDFSLLTQMSLIQKTKFFLIVAFDRKKSVHLIKILFSFQGDIHCLIFFHFFVF